jgi:hypothetical protein
LRRAPLPPLPRTNHRSQRGDGGEESGINFGHLCKEIRRATAKHARLKSKHAHQLSLLVSAKDGNIAALGRELDNIGARLAADTRNTNAAKAILRGLEASNVDLSAELAKTRQVMDQLNVKEDLKLESRRQKVKELESENVEIQGEIKGLHATLKEKEQELLDKEGYSQGDRSRHRRRWIGSKIPSEA